MKRNILFALLLTVVLLPLAALAQMPGAGAPADPLSAALKRMYDGVKRNVVEAAEKMPEADYGFKAGPMPEVRSYGQFVGHVANAAYSYCARSAGEKNPNEGNDLEKKTTKTELVEAIKAAFAYCDGVYGGLTDAKAMETFKAPGPGGTQVDVLRVTGLIGNVSHINEHYGNLVTYLRLKGMVPPSTERAQQMRRPSGN